jgi:hypothetical protein
MLEATRLADTAASAAPPQARPALTEGSELNAMSELGSTPAFMHGPRDWLCQTAGAAAPAGGSAVREATSVGAILFAHDFLGRRQRLYVCRPRENTLGILEQRGSIFRQVDVVVVKAP